MITMGGLFSGIGGFELAGTREGITPIWSNDIDPWACRVMRKNFDHEIIEADIRQITADRHDGRSKNKKKKVHTGRHAVVAGRPGSIRVPYVDIICGGFPCQPFSTAGKRQGTNDNRYLWPEMRRIIKEIGPRGVIGENVAGIVSMASGEPFEGLQNAMASQADLFSEEEIVTYNQEQRGVLAGIIEDLEGMGYTVETFAIPAAGVGAWHKRERIWIIAYTGSAASARYRPHGRENISPKGPTQRHDPQTVPYADPKGERMERRRAVGEQKPQTQTETSIPGRDHSGAGKNQ